MVCVTISSIKYKTIDLESPKNNINKLKKGLALLPIRSTKPRDKKTVVKSMYGIFLAKFVICSETNWTEALGY